MTANICDRSNRCLNFWLKERPGCNQCGVLITMNHFHHTLKHYRICHNCFEEHLEAIVTDTFRPTSWIEDEVRACLNYERCFASEPYGMFIPKVCDVCGTLYPPTHYHDIHRNIRVCLDCYQTHSKQSSSTGSKISLS